MKRSDDEDVSICFMVQLLEHIQEQLTMMVR